MVNATRGLELAARAGVADGWWRRFRGLLGTARIEPREGLLLTPCRSVHTWGMRYPIDVLFLDAEPRVLALFPSLDPGGRTPWFRDAYQVLEIPAGTIATTGTAVGDRIEIQPITIEPLRRGSLPVEPLRLPLSQPR